MNDNKITAAAAQSYTKPVCQEVQIGPDPDLDVAKANAELVALATAISGRDVVAVPEHQIGTYVSANAVDLSQLLMHAGIYEEVLSNPDNYKPARNM